MSANLTPQNFLPYENFSLGIRMKYPADWLKQDRAGIPLVGFFSPPEGPMDFFRENVTMSIDELPPGTTLQEYVDNSLAETRKVMPNLDVLASQDAQLSNLPAFEMLFTWSPGPVLFQCKLISTVSGNRSYTLNYTAETSKFDKFLGVAQEMMDSFEIA
jgi:hypothetical protein